MFKILVDERERKPWEFKGIPEDSRYGGGVMQIYSSPCHLHTGDYTTERLREVVTIERKSLADLYQTISQGKKRFTAEFDRMLGFKIAIVVVEASFEDLFHSPPRHTRLPPKAVSRCIMRLIITHPRVQWLFLGSRRVAEVWVAKFLAKCEREIK